MSFMRRGRIARLFLVVGLLIGTAAFSSGAALAATAAKPAATVAGCSTTASAPVMSNGSVKGQASVNCSSLLSSITVNVTLRSPGGTNYNASYTCDKYHSPFNNLYNRCSVYVLGTYQSGVWTTFGSSPEGGWAPTAPQSTL